MYLTLRCENLGIDWTPTKCWGSQLHACQPVLLTTSLSLKTVVAMLKINSMIGALECCKLELYRRLAAPYEDQVLDANGDAYTLSYQRGRRNINRLFPTKTGT
jgi:hypothetical protein